MFVSRKQAAILHADLDSFFASVEQRDDPRLRGKPVIVGGGVVLAASYEAKAYGVEGAMGGAKAKRLCPQAIVVPARMEAYSQASKDVFAVFEDMSPVVEGISIDEAFLDVRGMEHFAGTPRQIAERLRARVREEVGLPITVGVATTKHLAKIASADGQAGRAARRAGGGGARVPAPAAGRADLGRRAEDGGPAARARADDGRPGRRGAGGDADRDRRPRRRPAPARARQQPRPAAGQAPGAAALDRLPARARAPAPHAPRSSTRSSSGSWTA